MNHSDAKNNECRLYLIRHGATANNTANPPLLQGNCIDPGISEIGSRQAEQAADLLSELPLAAVYASPLVRAQETARPIAARHQLQVQTVAEIAEVDIGAWEGRSWDDISAADPEAYAQFMTRPDLHGYLGGENLTQVRDRVLPALTQLAEKHRGQTIAVVGHNVVNRCLLATMLKIPLHEARDLSQKNGGVNVMRYRNDWKVVTFNSIFHLSTSQATPS